MKHITLVTSTPATKLACNIIIAQAKNTNPDIFMQQYHIGVFRRLLEDEVIGRGCAIYAFLSPEDSAAIQILQDYNFTKLKVITKMSEWFDSIDGVITDTPTNLIGTLANSNNVSLLHDVFDKHPSMLATRLSINNAIKLIPAFCDYRDLSKDRAYSRSIRNSIKTVVNDTNVYFLLSLITRPTDESIAHTRDVLGNDIVVLMVSRNYVHINMKGVHDVEKRHWFTTYFNGLYAIGKNEPKTFSPEKDCLTYSRSAEVDAILKRQFSEYAAAMIS